jgi:integrase
MRNPVAMLYESEFPLCHEPAHASHGHIQPLGRGLHAIEFVLGIVALAALCEWRGRFLDVLLEHFVFPTERVSGTGPRRSSDGMDPTRPIGSWKTAFHSALRKSGVECRWHDLRHSSASRFGEGGVPEQTLFALCGWMSRKMLERYSHTRLEAQATRDRRLG